MFYVWFAPTCMYEYVCLRIPSETPRMGSSSYIFLSYLWLCFSYHLGNPSNGSELWYINVFHITSETPRTGPSYYVSNHNIYPHSYPRPLSYYKFIVTYHTPHTSPSYVYPDYVPKYRGGGGLNVSHCLHLFRHIMFGNRGDVGTEFLPRIYSRREKFP
jgi:hypothetical protein